jgi:hypothetical protein
VISLDIYHTCHVAGADELVLSHSADLAIVTQAMCAQIRSPEYEQMVKGSFQVENEAYEWDLRKGSPDAAGKVYALRPNPVLRLLVGAYSV